MGKRRYRGSIADGVFGRWLPLHRHGTPEPGGKKRQEGRGRQEQCRETGYRLEFRRRQQSALQDDGGARDSAAQREQGDSPRQPAGGRRFNAAQLPDRMVWRQHGSAQPGEEQVDGDAAGGGDGKGLKRRRLAVAVERRQDGSGTPRIGNTVSRQRPTASAAIAMIRSRRVGWVVVKERWPNRPLSRRRRGQATPNARTKAPVSSIACSRHACLAMTTLKARETRSRRNSPWAGRLVQVAGSSGSALRSNSASVNCRIRLSAAELHQHIGAGRHQFGLPAVAVEVRDDPAQTLAVGGYRLGFRGFALARRRSQRIGKLLVVAEFVRHALPRSGAPPPTGKPVRRAGLRIRHRQDRPGSSRPAALSNVACQPESVALKSGGGACARTAAGKPVRKNMNIIVCRNLVQASMTHQRKHAHRPR